MSVTKKLDKNHYPSVLGVPKWAPVFLLAQISFSLSAFAATDLVQAGSAQSAPCAGAVQSGVESTQYEISGILNVIYDDRKSGNPQSGSAPKSQTQMNQDVASLYAHTRAKASATQSGDETNPASWDWSSPLPNSVVAHAALNQSYLEDDTKPKVPQNWEDYQNNKGSYGKTDPTFRTPFSYGGMWNEAAFDDYLINSGGDQSLGFQDFQFLTPSIPRDPKTGKVI